MYVYQGYLNYCVGIPRCLIGFEKDHFARVAKSNQQIDISICQ